MALGYGRDDARKKFACGACGAEGHKRNSRFCPKRRDAHIPEGVPPPLLISQLEEKLRC